LELGPHLEPPFPCYPTLVHADGARILGYLKCVADERLRRATISGLAANVSALKAFQHRRFAHSYADLLRNPHYRSAAKFFLEELYGPTDFAKRDQQFERIVPALIRLFPSELISTVTALAELHSLSEQLDTRMGLAMSDPSVTPEGYVTAWCSVGMRESRERQIQLTTTIGSALERYTRRRLLRATLHAMRRPASIAGLGDLQRFLETGFDTFSEIPDPGWFLGQVEKREQALLQQLFNGDTSSLVGVSS
jgi:hypothetical protein